MKIDNFNQSNVKTLHEEIVAALSQIAERHGLSLRKSRVNYTGAAADYKVEFAVLDESGEALREKQLFHRYMQAYGLNFKVGDTVSFPTGERILIRGWNKGKRKNPIIGKMNGRDVCFSLETLRRATVVERAEQNV